jgi:hypothetical protein
LSGSSKVHVTERKILQVRYTIVSFDRVYQKTSKALGVSYTSVHRIMNGKRPCKSNRPKERAEFFDDFDHCVIKRTIHGLQNRTKI